MPNFLSIAGQVCAIGGLDLGAFVQFAAEDEHTGYGTDRQWPGMSISADEGRVLYALVRMLKPLCPLEIGVWNGCSTRHMLEAMKANGAGRLTSVDVQGKIPVHILPGLVRSWDFILGDALVCELPEFDFVFEDGPHTREFTGQMIRRVMTINPNVTAVVSHDCLYPEWGHGITDGWRDAGLEPHVVDTGRGMCFHFRGQDET